MRIFLIPAADSLSWHLQCLPSTQHLQIETVDISTSDVKAIKAALPNCKADFKPMSDAEKEALLVKKPGL